LRGDPSILANGLYIGEGEIDYLRTVTAFSDADEDAPCVVGIVSGAWSQTIADKITDGCLVIYLDQNDKTATRYGDEIETSLKGRTRFVREVVPND
jgi:hypothetical protein